MIDDPLVSIIIPTFNGAKYIKRAILSALSQDYSNIEIVISDNASTDLTEEICCEFVGNPKFRYFRNPANIGMVKNFQKALAEYSVGKYALILSDDDYLTDSRYISKAVGLFNLHPKIVLIHANCSLVNEQTNVVKSTAYKIPMVYPGIEYLINYYSDKAPNIISTVTSVFRRDTALQLHAFSHDILGFDADLYFRLMLSGDIGFIPDNVAVYTLRERSMSHYTDLKNDLEFVNALIEISEELKSLSVDQKTIGKWIRQQTLMYFRYRYTVYFMNKKPSLVWILAYEYFKKVKMVPPFWEFRHLLHATMKSLAK